MIIGYESSQYAIVVSNLRPCITLVQEFWLSWLSVCRFCFCLGLKLLGAFQI